MSQNSRDPRIKTGVPNLDAILCGGFPKGSVTVLAGSPGAGKTILTQQILFSNASAKNKAIIFNTLSEPTAKTLRYLKQFDFFDSNQLENEIIHFVDLGGIMRSKGLQHAVNIILENLKRVTPAFVVIDSFKVFEDLATSREELRKFSYEVAIQLMAWETTVFSSASLINAISSPILSFQLQTDSSNLLSVNSPVSSKD